MPRPDRHRAELVAATAQLLRRRGYANTSVTAALRAAGATNGSLYHHFPAGKVDLARAALEAVGAQIEGGVRSALAGTEDIAAATQGWIDGLIAALDADPRDGCPVAPTAIESAGTDEALRATSAAVFARWGAVFEEALGRTRPAATAAAQARVLLSAIEGALLLDRTAQGTEHLRALRDAVPALLASR